MTPRTVFVLLALGIVALAGGWYFGVATVPQEHETVAAGGLMFPNLAQQLQAATKVEITHQGKQTVIEKRPDGGWGIAAMHDYPVQEAKLRGMLTALTELRLAEARTADPAAFGRLGVDDPNGATSTADLLRVVDKSGKPILAVIVGHRRVRSQGNVPEEVYVRRPGDNQSWLAEGSLQVDADPSLWLDRDIMNIGSARIASVVVGDNALVFGRTDGRFTLTQPAQHPKLEDYKVDDVSRGLETLTMESVKDDAEAPKAAAGHAVFTTAEGLAVTVTVLHADKDVWARFVASGTGKAKAEADRLNTRLAGWTYQIGPWKETSLVPTLDGLKAEEPAKPVQAAAPNGVPGEVPGEAPVGLPGGIPGGAPGGASPGTPAGAPGK